MTDTAAPPPVRSRFKDHFSGHAESYARYRPRYPAALFAYLASLPGHRDAALDCGTGSGQAALGLCDHFRQVLATDPSLAQLCHAVRHPGVAYCTARAEALPFPGESLDLVSVAQALHWFELPAFYAEVHRVLRPGGVLAVWAYGLAQVGGEVDRMVADLYHDTLGRYWPEERTLVDQGYRSLPFPFPELTAPRFSMQASWDLQALLGYLATWSAARRFAAARGFDPVAAVAARLAAAWGEPEALRTVTWALHLRAGIRP